MLPWRHMRHGCAALAPILALLGCATEAPPRGATDATPAGAPRSAEYRYRVSAGLGAEQISVEVDLPPGPSAARTWALDPPLHPFVRDVSLTGARGLSAAPAAPGGGWLVPACPGGGCRLRYRVQLAEAARSLGDLNRALTSGSAVVSPPSAWLLRPSAERAPFSLTVSAAPGDSFVCGMALAASEGPGAGVFRGDVGSLDDTPYAAFGRLVVSRRSLPGGVVDVAFDGAAGPAVEGWVDGALRAVTAYYGHFPIPHAALIVHVEPGESGVFDGHTMGEGGGAGCIAVGDHATSAALARDWTLVHELVHVSFPNVSTPWAEEGLATYLEPIIRVRSGLCDADELWRSLVEGLPQGQPGPGDGGLDVTDTWGRRYWGGAMFWLVADVEIRKQTGNARSLDDVLRAVNRAGGNAAVRWPLDRVLAMGDAETGVSVLEPLRKKLGGAPLRMDLEALWKSLGIAQVGGKMVYDDAAPLAGVRRAIETGAAPGRG